jgi:YVTN family beta-propeller protein
LSYKYPFLLVGVIALCIGCSRPTPVQQVEKKASPEITPGPKLYVSNEASGDMTIINAKTYGVEATIPLGKRPRGIHASPDGV